MKKLSERILTLALTLTLLLGLAPAIRATSAAPAFDQVAKVTGAALYEGRPDPGNPPLSSGPPAPLLKQPDNLYLKYTFTLTGDEITPGTPYQVALPIGLKISAARGSESLTLTFNGKPLHFADLTWDSAAGVQLAFTQEFIDECGDVLELITDCNFYVGCAFDQPHALTVDGEANRYRLTFADSSSLVVGLDRDEVREIPGKLSKSAGAFANGEFLWTITYTPYQNSPMTVFEIRDELDNALTPAFLLLDGRVDPTKVTVLRGDDPISCNLAYDNDSRTLVISEMGENHDNWGQQITITYPTAVDPRLSLPSATAGGSASVSNQGKTVPNTASLYGAKQAGDPLQLLLTARASGDIPTINYLRKQVEQVNGNSRLLKWTVTVNRGAIPADVPITLKDQLPPSLHLVTEDDVPAGALAPQLNEEKTQLTLDDSRTFSLSTVAAGAGGKAELVYYTVVDEAYFQSGESLGDNRAWMEFTIDKTDYAPSVTVGVGKGAGISTALLTKANAGFGQGESYLRSQRSSQWTVTLNPNKADLTSAELTDNIHGIAAGSGCMGQKGHDTGASLNWDNNYTIQLQFAGAYSDSVTVTAADWADKTHTVTAGMIGGAGETPLLTLKETEEGDLEFSVGAIGRTAVTVTYVTRLNDPCLYVGDLDPDKVNYLTVKNGVSGSANFGGRTTVLSGSAQAKVSSKMLVKGKPVYDYATGRITWTVTVNDSGMEMTDVVLTDVLPEGLSYVDGSLKVTEGDPTEQTAAETDRTLTIHLGSVTQKTALSFETQADTQALGFGGGDGVISISNTISMTGRALDTGFDVSATGSGQISNHGLSKKGAVRETDGQIDYEVVINPFHIPLENASVTDRLPEGLRLDPDSVHLYPADVSGNTGAGCLLFAAFPVGMGGAMIPQGRICQNIM